ncbi:hypothetical protein [Pseudomonas aeruginosa]|uniref:hypothetical protein n=1 Tax=Pseudomonas aeruginosa TaxID=287 RepID=UPI003CC91318
MATGGWPATCCWGDAALTVPSATHARSAQAHREWTPQRLLDWGERIAPTRAN